MVDLDSTRDNQDKAETARGNCGCELFDGDCRYEWEGKMLCPDCFKAAVESLLDRNPGQIALEMGLYVERCG